MKHLLTLSFFVLLFAGCKSTFTDVSNEVSSSNIPLPDNTHVYSATWLTEKTIMFVEDLDWEDFDNNVLASQNSKVLMGKLYAYDINTKKWAIFPIDANLDCDVQDVGLLERLPNGNLGLVQDCRENNFGNIREFNISTNKTRILFENHAYLHWVIGIIGTYAFSPHMTELVQEDATGYLLDNQLYYVVPGKIVKQIVPEFNRAKDPAWSPHNREIAFWGTANYSGGNPNDFKALPQILGLAGNPWDLYLSTPEGNEVRLILSSIDDPGAIEWSPTKNIIAFSGEFEGVEGLWLFDPITLEITRVWNKRVGLFSWSLDGTKIITNYVKYADFPKIEEQSVDIIDIP